MSPRLSRPDGVDIHWEERGEGPLVVLAPFIAHHPSAFADLIADLTRDHRVVRYDARGTGESTRAGPHDIETNAADLAAVIERAGPPAVVVTGGDGLNLGLRVAAQRLDHIRALVGVGVVSPVGFKGLQTQTDALMTSDSVMEMIIEQLQRDYRGALRAIVPLANQQMSEDEVRARVDAQVCTARQRPSSPSSGRGWTTTRWSRPDGSEIVSGSSGTRMSPAPRSRPCPRCRTSLPGWFPTHTSR